MQVPELDIIIPVYNDPCGVKDTLESLISQSSSIDYRVSVVDNQSTDSTREVVQGFVERFDHISLLLENEVQSSYAARNTGIRLTSANYLAFIDANVVLPEDWIESFFRDMNALDIDYLAFEVELFAPSQTNIASRYDRHTGFPTKRYIHDQHFAPTNCLVVQRSVFDDVGLFDSRLISGGDKEFGNRVHDAGLNMQLCSDIVVRHPTRNSVRQLVIKDWRVGRGLCQLQRYHSHRYGKPGIPPSPSGIKKHPLHIPLRERIGYSLLGTVLTAVRGLGYYREFLFPTTV